MQERVFYTIGNFVPYRIKKDAPLWMRTRAKRKLLPDGNRARRECASKRTLFYYISPVPFYSFSPAPFISSTNSRLFTVSSTHAGLKPLRMAVRTDRIFDQAAQ